jgi:uncharacterized membrane protein
MTRELLLEVLGMAAMVVVGVRVYLYVRHGEMRGRSMVGVALMLAGLGLMLARRIYFEPRHVIPLSSATVVLMTGTTLAAIGCVLIVLEWRRARRPGRRD